MISQDIIHQNVNISNIDLHVYNTVTSTNDIAKQLLQFYNNQALPIVVSDEQTAGKGRLGRKFYSPKGSGIYLSIVLKANDFKDNPLLSTTLASVAVCRAIETVVPSLNPLIKWVNDVYIDNKKVCGILTEGVISSNTNTISHLIVGIGINVHSQNFSEHAIDNATFLTCNNNHIDRNVLIAEIINNIYTLLQAIQNDDFTFMEYYRSHSMIIGKNIKVFENPINEPNKYYFAKALDIAPDGSLIIALGNNSQKVLNTGEVTIRTI